VTHVVEPPSYLYDSGEMPLNMPELDGPARRRVRTAHPLGRVPVIVVPRGARSTIGSLFGPSAVADSA